MQTPWSVRIHATCEFERLIGSSPRLTLTWREIGPFPRTVAASGGHGATPAGACALATSPIIRASSRGRDHIGQWLVGRSTQLRLRSSGIPARKDHSGCSFAYAWYCSD